MIRVGLVGAADPRHRWFLAAAHRRRAGVRIVGLSEPDDAVREETAGLYGIPTWADHISMLEATAPSLVAIAQPDSGRVVIDALRHNADVLVAPPICDSVAELEMITELAAVQGRRVTAAHTYRGHPAARTAVELVERRGPPELVSLLLGGAWEEAPLRQAIMEGLDVFRWLTGESSITATAIAAGHPARDDDSPEIRTAYGELILLGAASGVADGGSEGSGLSTSGPTFEVRHRPDTVEGNREVIQVSNEAGAFEWDTRTGLMRSAFDGRPPITVSCGRPDQPEWVLNNLLRKARPVISPEESLDLMRVLLR